MIFLSLGHYMNDFIIAVSALLMIRIIVRFIRKNTRPRTINSKSSSESTKWLNFIISRIVQISNDPNFIRELNNSLEYHSSQYYFKILSLGKRYTISSASTYVMKDADDIRLSFPITVEYGPSFDIGTGNKRFIVEFDLQKLECEVLFQWLGNTQEIAEISLVNNIDLDFHLNVVIFGFFHFSLTNTFFIGSIIKDLIIIYLLRLRIKIPFPSLDDVEVIDY